MAGFRTGSAIILSFLLTVSVVLNAFYQRKQFYPSVVYLTKSNLSMAVRFFVYLKNKYSSNYLHHVLFYNFKKILYFQAFIFARKLNF
jgi:E3 ubiquitin-protein ligase synoviolin